MATTVWTPITYTGITYPCELCGAKMYEIKDKDTTFALDGKGSIHVLDGSCSGISIEDLPSRAGFLNEGVTFDVNTGFTAPVSMWQLLKCSHQGRKERFRRRSNAGMETRRAISADTHNIIAMPSGDTIALPKTMPIDDQNEIAAHVHALTSTPVEVSSEPESADRYYGRSR